MKRVLIIIICFYALTANAQNYLITFSGSGASTTVSSIKVENLTKGTSLTINGSDILRLTTATGINSIEDNQSSGLKIYPNPMTDNATLEIFPPVQGNAIISVYDITGKLVALIQSYLENFRQDFRISGLKTGFYFISVLGNNYRFSSKLVSNGKSNETISFEKITNTIKVVDKKEERTESKGNQATIDMKYTTGDRLKFTGSSANYSTIKMDIPTSDKTITFNFIACTDGDNNNYSIVEIGAQVWMAENLRTTKYNDNTAIPFVTDNTSWANLTSGAYCDYLNTPAYSTTYGRLYNWYTADNNAATKVASNGGKNICPTSWHVPSDDEWTTLTTYLGGEDVAGGKLKEIGIEHWNTPNDGATNEYGFTALPGGTRYDAYFGYGGITGYWWSSTDYSSTNAWRRCVFNQYSFVTRTNYLKFSGHSVRCIKN